ESVSPADGTSAEFLMWTLTFEKRSRLEATVCILKQHLQEIRCRQMSGLSICHRISLHPVWLAYSVSRYHLSIGGYISRTLYAPVKHMPVCGGLHSVIVSNFQAVPQRHR